MDSDDSSSTLPVAVQDRSFSYGRDSSHRPLNIGSADSQVAVQPLDRSFCYGRDSSPRPLNIGSADSQVAVQPLDRSFCYGRDSSPRPLNIGSADSQVAVQPLDRSFCYGRDSSPRPLNIGSADSQVAVQPLDRSFCYGRDSSPRPLNIGSADSQVAVQPLDRSFCYGRDSSPRPLNIGSADSQVAVQPLDRSFSYGRDFSPRPLNIGSADSQVAVQPLDRSFSYGHDSSHRPLNIGSAETSILPIQHSPAWGSHLPADGDESLLMNTSLVQFYTPLAHSTPIFPDTSASHSWILPTTRRVRPRRLKNIHGRIQMTSLFDDFIKCRNEDIEDDFRGFLLTKGYKPPRGDALEYARLLIRESKSPFADLGLTDINHLTDEDKLSLLKMKTLSRGQRSFCFNWILTMMKHSKLGIDVLQLFINRHYGFISIWNLSNEQDVLARSPKSLFYLSFFARMLDVEENDVIKLVPPNLTCPYCSLIGIHFADECHVKHSQEMKRAHLQGYCALCTKGRSCIGLHDQELSCLCGEDPAHEVEMCQSDTAVQKNRFKVRNLRMAELCFKGWATARLRRLFVNLLEWYDENPDCINSHRLKSLREYMDFQMTFPSRYRKVLQ